jgi:hypothetical protein
MNQEHRPEPGSIEAEAQAVAAGVPMLYRAMLAPVVKLLLRMARALDTLERQHHERQADNGR